MSDPHDPAAHTSRLSGAARSAPVHTLTEAFDAQADRTPDATAVADDRTHVSYRTLQHTSAVLAQVLHERGVAPGDRVALCMGRRIPLLTALLAIWRCGAHYVPLDPTWPPGLIDDLLADAAPRLLLTDADTTSLPTHAVAGLAVLRADEPHTVTTSTAGPSSRAQLSGTAYLIYTSGTTGRPKGVPVTHGALMQYLTWASHHYDTAGGAGTLVHSSIAADLTVTSLLLPLMTGQRVQLVPSDDPGDVARTLSEARDLSPLKVTPGGLRLLTRLLTGEQLGRAVRHLVVGGEQLTAHALSDLDVPGLTVTNEYGPTEATVGCTWFTFRCGAPVPDPVPIGRPVWNTTVELRTPGTGEPVPCGGTGELVVVGPQVAAGYQDRPEESAARFSTDTRGDHAYRTGDLARIRPDGHLEMLGRIDEQLKIHGYRVEPAEIEAVLTGDPSIADAAVVATRTGATGAPVLSAFLVPATTAQKASVVELARTLCERQLPFYARPDHLRVLDALPLQPSGKVDRRALAALSAPAPADLEGLADHDDPVLGTLARLWTGILGEPPHSREANFFTSGGDSLKAVLYANAVQRAGLPLTVHDVLHHRTLGRIAEVLTTAQAADEAPVADGPVPLSALQTAILTSRPVLGAWALRYSSDAPHQDVDPIRLQQAFEIVVHRHPALRSTFSFADSGGWSARLAPFAARGIHLLDLSGHQAGDHDEIVHRRLAEREGHLDLTGPLVDLALIGGGGRPRIAWIVHHLVADLVSLQILTHDLWHAYDHPASPPAAAAGDDGYVHWLKSAQDLPQLPTGPWLTESPRTTATLLGPDVRDTLITAQKESSRRPLALLASSLLAALAEVRPDLPAALCVELHGRDRAGHDLAATVGWLTSLRSVHAARALLADPAALADTVHTQLKNTSPEPGGPLAPIALNYLGELPEGSLELPPTGAAGPLFGLEVVCFTQPGTLQIRWRACPAWMPDATVPRLAAAFARHAAALPTPGAGPATAHELAQITAAFGNEGP